MKKIIIYILLIFIICLSGCSKKDIKLSCNFEYTETLYDRTMYEVYDEMLEIEDLNDYRDEYIISCINYNIDYSDTTDTSYFILEFENDSEFVSLVKCDTANYQIKDDKIKLQFSLNQEDKDKQVSGYIFFKKKVNYEMNVNCIFEDKNEKYATDLMNEYIYLGSYPQTQVSDNELINKLNSLSSTNTNGYYEYNGEEYCKISVIESTEWYKVEPIKWKILSKENKELTLLSDQLLEAMQFDNDNNKYNDSDIRTWLLNDFYNKAFSEEEKNKIQENSKVNNDKVWLLSKKDVKSKKYFSSKDEKIAQPTDYALATGAIESDSQAGIWWLRTSLNGYDDAEFYVCSDGSYKGNFINSILTCVRPAIIINIE